MNPIATDFVDYVCREMPRHNKRLAEEAAKERFGLTRDGRVYYHKAFAVRFSYSAKGTFSNTVLALSVLQKYDSVPFFVVVVRGKGDNLIYLANSTFLKKVSHSSHDLRADNIRGSFNGSDIYKVYDGIENRPSNFEELFAIHESFSWESNLIRLVEATGNMVPFKTKFLPSNEQMKSILSSVERAKIFVESSGADDLEKDLRDRVSRNIDAIAVASRIENTNIRGAMIEYLITRAQDVAADWSEMEDGLPRWDLKHGLGDYVRRFEDAGANTYTDVKTKILYRSSNPKGYNIDSFLETMAEEDSVFMLYLIGIGREGLVDCKLCSVYDHRLIAATRFRSEWASSATRGTTQFVGKMIEKEIIENPDFRTEVVEGEAHAFLRSLLER